jgi:GTP-binding protein
MSSSDNSDMAERAELARRLFAGKAEFFWGTDKLASLPPATRPEIAFAGRSNVGKSSLINALTGRNALARTSHTPGRTQELNFFEIGEDRLTLVDMPGYGFAQVSKEKVMAWTRTIQEYLKGRPVLARVYVLIDSRHGLKALDHEILDLMDAAAVSYQIVLTKIDELKAGEAERQREAVLTAIHKRVAAFPEVLLTSSRKNEGIADLRLAVLTLLEERGG